MIPALYPVCSTMPENTRMGNSIRRLRPKGRQPARSIAVSTGFITTACFSCSSMVGFLWARGRLEPSDLAEQVLGFVCPDSSFALQRCLWCGHEAVLDGDVDGSYEIYGSLRHLIFFSASWVARDTYRPVRSLIVTRAAGVFLARSGVFIAQAAWWPRVRTFGRCVSGR